MRCGLLLLLLLLFEAVVGMCRVRVCGVQPRRDLGAVIVVLTCLCCIGGRGAAADGRGRLQYCSFFNNRAPKAQPGLRNCTWFKEDSCCLQQEIEATFGRVKPLKGASPACQTHINYLMCYICAPNQNVFYQKERLTVCEEFCNRWYGACKNAILKGSIIGELYDSGTEFCRSRRFLVSRTSCFYFDVTMDTTSATRSKHRAGPIHRLLIYSVLVLFAIR